jgi:hypothetical protein
MQLTKESRRAQFERALLDVLVMDYDLRVRRKGDRLERRHNGYATLLFDYPGDDDPSDTKVVVQIDGVEGFSCLFHADLTSFETIVESAETCESLALAIIEVTETFQLAEAEDPGDRRACAYGRRAED